MSSVSLVIISYNGKEFLQQCLERVGKSVVKPDEVIVVDDGSTDGTDTTIRAMLPNITFIRHDRNRGPTAARNSGAKRAHGDHIIFCDNDTYVRPETIGELSSFLDNHTDAGVCGALLKPTNTEKMWWNMGYDPNNFRESVGYCIGALIKLFPHAQFLRRISEPFILNYWDYNRVRTVGWVVERCFAVRRGVFETVGGFDEQFFMFYEGPDLCKQFRNTGYTVYFNPNAVADVLDGHTHDGIKRSRWFLWSKYRFYKKHYFYLKSNPVFFWLGRAVSGFFYLLAS